MGVANRYNEFLEYNSIEQYKKDIMTCLAEDTWHYSRELVEDMISDEEEFIQKCYSNRVSALDCALDIGFVG